MKVFVIEKDNNLELVETLNKKYFVEENICNLKECRAVIVSNVCNVNLALKIVDIALQMGIEVICVMPSLYKYGYVSRILKRDGCMVI